MPTSALPTIEYRLRPVTRYVVTRYEEGGGDGPDAPKTYGTSTTHGEFDNADTAYAVGYALAQADHNRYGYAPADQRIRYPEHPAMQQACKPLSEAGQQAILNNQQEVLRQRGSQF